MLDRLKKRIKDRLGVPSHSWSLGNLRRNGFNPGVIYDIGAYTGEWKLDERRTLLRWKGKIQGHELESFDLIEENDEGLIVDRTIAFRPMPAAKLFRDAMRAAMGSAIPDDYWEYSN